MHPALSVIIFTAVSGAGYGILMVVGVLVGFDVIDVRAPLVRASAMTAVVLVTAGLLSSTFHLGHPERAWRAFSQWRTSWLSREGVLAVVTYVPAAVLIGAAFNWIPLNNASAIAGLSTAICAAATVMCTAMIYASLRSISAWHHPLVPVIYLSFAITCGLVVMTLFARFYDYRIAGLSAATFIALSITGLVKLRYWRLLDTTPAASTVNSALGIADGHSAELTQAPHSETNYLQQEMGFQIARRHAQKLRRLSLIAAIAVPAVMIAIAQASSGGVAVVSTGIACLCLAIGVLIERWLFFAEAKHTVMLYYGARTA